MLTPSGPVQSAYTHYQLPAQNGMLATETNWDASTCIVETPEGIPFGRAVSWGTLSDQGCVIGGSNFRGITRADPTIIMSSNLDTDVYPEGDNAGVLTKGDLWVYCTEDVSFGDPVHYDAGDGTLSSSGGTAIEGAVWMKTAVAGPNLTVAGHDDPVPTFLSVVRLSLIAGKV